jgi:hypothetical protein
LGGREPRVTRKPSDSHAGRGEVYASNIEQMLSDAAAPVRAFTAQLLSVRPVYEQVAIALANADGGDELVQAHVDCMECAYGLGFGIDLDSATTRTTERVAALESLHRLPKVVMELVRDYVASDNAILLWGMEGADLQFVQSLDVRDVDWTRNKPGELAIKIPSNVRAAIKATTDEAVLKTLYAPAVVAAVRANQSTYLARNKDGQFWTFISRGRRFTTFPCKPSQFSIFCDVLIRQMLIAGDFSVAFFAKSLILHATQGESITQGPRAGSRDNWIKTGTQAKLNAALKKLGKAMTVVADHTFKVNYYAPDPGLLSEARYAALESRIDNWGGVPEQIRNGRGKAFGQGILGARRFEMKGKRVRADVGAAVMEFLTHPQVQAWLGLPRGNASLSLRWDWSVFRDATSVTKERNDLWDRGMLSDQTYLTEVGRSYAVELARKKEERKEAATLRPLFERSQGILSGGSSPDAGRPRKKAITNPETPRSGEQR